ncbi:MAG TPA: hypothetical protein VHG93_08985 [Longimicrobium sp.]|nr:hypothetical protein [Longimicrobium sp.]
MRKLRLKVEQLQVESFAVRGEAARGEGTVRGHAEATYGCTEGWVTCPYETIDQVTCWSCNETERGFTCIHGACA